MTPLIEKSQRRPAKHTPAKTTAKKVTPGKKTVRKPISRPSTVSKISSLKIAKPERTHKLNYIFSVGRRKEAVARVRWKANEPVNIIVNGRQFSDYFPTFELQHIVRQPLVLTHNDKLGSVSVKVSGGGINGQAESVRLGIARALVKVDPDLRLVLKRAGFMRRDPRVKERKKYGLKRARRAPQWQKR